MGRKKKEKKDWKFEENKGGMKKVVRTRVYWTITKKQRKRYRAYRKEEVPDGTESKQ
jgi:hypothetical protein